MPEPTNHHDERALWRRVAAPPGASRDACPPLTDLAALVDGRLTDDERAAIETHLADCPECLAAVHETHAIRGDEATERTYASPSIIARAKALVTGVPEVTVRVTRRVSWQHVGRWSAVAASILATCLLGYQAGAGSVSETAESIDLAAEMSFGAIVTEDEEAAPELDLFVENGETGEVQP
ncbi:MAG: anti-sigma factor family protein [Planctomycetota bacterium]|jgi:anti-sigma factor RsiW